MHRLSSRRHRQLMDESEYALHEASDSSFPLVSRIVSTLLQDGHIYGQWESQHANLLLPVAEHSKKKRQIMALRNAEVQLVHQRALFNYLRTERVRGEERRQVFRIFHSTRDYHDTVLAEHRQYMLAVSSRVSADHIVDVMHDPNSKNLLRQYEKLYTRYFAMKCYVAGMGDSRCVDLVRSGMGDAHDRLQQARRRGESEPPTNACGNFDRQEALARSGRYPILDYMVG